MGTSQDLVPNDLPYGERQQFVDAAQAGGIATATPTGQGGSPSPPSRPAQPGVIPPNYDVFANRQPGVVEGAPVSNTDLRRQRLLEHPNPIYRDLARRILS